MAFLVNLSIYWIIGSTSALTYNMVGYFKFSLIIGIGAFLFDDPVTYQQILSIITVMAGNLSLIKFFQNWLIYYFLKGLILYSYFKIQESKVPETKPTDDAEKGLVTNK